MKLHTIALGCQMSSADAEELSRPWLARGYTLTEDIGEADAVIVNTCTVRQHAEDRAASLIGRLRDWKEARPGRTLIVAGCAAERLGPRLRTRFPHVDLVVGARSIEDYPRLLAAAFPPPAPLPVPPLPPRSQVSMGAPSGERSTTGAFRDGSPLAAVTITRGCDQRCGFCIVPSVRGPQRCRALADVLREVRARAEGGAREITLLGQTVNAWRDGERGFAELLRAAAGVPGVARLRFMSPHPLFLDPGTMAAMAECPTVAPHLHLPVQSGSDRILRAMGRGHGAEEYLDKVRALRRLRPELALSTDFIVGFPGEGEADFARTLELAEAGGFCSAYCYKFSARAGTPAAGLAGDLPLEVKEERLARLLGLVEARTRERLAGLVGRRVQVLLETPTDGRTQYHFRARLDGPGRPGSIVEAEVVGHTRTALRCRAVA
ncbi:MAG: hypothetical protein A2X36_00420 [Elusimicrobia bacterium GWA2_69_24]|nr:MAG: hypothetical protein A2X36_00420 [Elusimicrobia bacterium GWA2_69_24]HBL16772.1 tRNA (N6-isopentenyl adenosine(37)-C2)-methylthiotransferase MiaB [Elusimicrobiota bacterium]